MEQDYTSYHYSIIRYYHDAKTSEFLNIGLALYAPEFNYFRTLITTRYQRLTDTFYNADGEAYRAYIIKLQRRFDALSKDIENQQLKLFDNKDFNIINLLRKYLRKDSSFQYSNPANGITLASENALQTTFDHLYNDYVEKYITKTGKTSRTEEEVWRGVYRPKIEKINSEIIHQLQPKEIHTEKDNLVFDYAWKNGKYHLLEPISFDLATPHTIINKAHRNLGRNVLLNSSREIASLYLLLGKPINKEESVFRSYERAKDIIQPNGFDYKYNISIIEEDEAEDFATYISKEVIK